MQILKKPISQLDFSHSDGSHRLILIYNLANGFLALPDASCEDTDAHLEWFATLFVL